jgi:heterodisulfide reductase subunit A
VAVIGAGPAGAAAAQAASLLGLAVDWYEKEPEGGGKLSHYHQLFPGREPARSVHEDLFDPHRFNGVTRRFGQAVTRLEPEGAKIRIVMNENEFEESDTVIVANGFDFFDARLKEEFGYGIYPRVITAPDLERFFQTDARGLRSGDQDPEAIAFVHCVGSRDQQVGVPYCSRVCCITGIKQAIEIRELFPLCRVYNFYIDIRAYGNGYEELYREAQEKHGIRFIRGRVSEASEDEYGRIRVKAEDTLLGRPVKVTVDWLVLLVGMVPACQELIPDGISDRQISGRSFLQSTNPFSGQAAARMPGVFLAGACSGPMSIPESVASGRSAAIQAFEYLKSRR